ncbi:MAG: 4Fe-4S single cluster domain-containing protein [Patescibacteria group bacterium]
MILRVGRVVECTPAMGPGQRLCLWVKGCTIGCHGCTTPELWGDGGNLVAVDALITCIAQAQERFGIEGVSFSGGEPFEQARALAQIAHAAKEQGLSVLCWSGYTRKFLRGAHAPDGARELLRELDVLIDGRFVQLLAVDNLPLRGSSNQRVHLLTGRYRSEDLDSVIALEIDGGQVVSHGVTDHGRIASVLRLLGLGSHA